MEMKKDPWYSKCPPLLLIYLLLGAVIGIYSLIKYLIS